MFKKMLMIASMALAVVALAAPASALANWTHEEKELEENATLTFSGPAGFACAACEAGADAELTAEITLEAGSLTGKVTKVSAANCIGTGKLANTTCTSTFEGLPWTVHANPLTGKLTITNIKITNNYWAINVPHTEKPLSTTVLTGNIVATPNSAASISTVTLAGEGTVVNGVAPATVSGDLAASPAGTYGFE